MPFVLFTTVTIADLEKARAGLHEIVIPNVTKAPGFLRGTWAADPADGRGIGVEVYETRAQAEAVAEQLRSHDGPPGPQGVSFETITIYEVQGEA